MAQNPKQFDVIVSIETNLAYLYKDAADVWIGKDQFWYPVKGKPRIVQAPDVFVVFGRPNQYRPTYKQWEDGDVPPQVVIEVLSPSNTEKELISKRAFYEKYGVEEYYVVDPDCKFVEKGLEVYLRDKKDNLSFVHFEDVFISPRMGVKFEIKDKPKKKDAKGKEKGPGKEVVYYHPNGAPFLSTSELRELYEVTKDLFTTARKSQERAEESLEKEQEARELAEALVEKERKAKEAAQKAAVLAQELAEEERAEKEAAQRQADTYAELLRKMGIDVDNLP